MSSIKFKIEKYAGDNDFGLWSMKDRDKGPSCSSRFGRCLESYIQDSKLLKNLSDKRKIRHCQQGTYHDSSFPR